MAKGKIRGITIELSADATGVMDAINKVSTKLNSVTKEMRDVNKLLKLDPTNFTLIGQKSQILKEGIAAAKEKLDELKLAQQDMKNNGVDENSEQYRALQREIASVEQELRTLQNTAGSASATMAKISAVTGTIGTKMENLGKKWMPVTMAIGGGFTAAAKTAIDFETAFAGVQKTVDGTDEQYEAIKQGIIDMSQETASSAVDIAAVAEAAGQLGIRTDDILDFTKTMVMLGDTTNLSAEEAASSLAKFANISGTSSQDYGRLGSVIVDLGNNFATTERDITEMATNLASAGRLAGLTEPEIFALATAMSSVGIEAQAGGTAMTQTLTALETAVVNGGDNLYKIADIAGMTAEDFSTAWKTDPIKAIEGFITGLGKLDEQGESATLVLDELGMSGIRQSNMLKSLGLAADTMSGAIDTASQAWENNTALSDEASKKYETTAAKIAQLKATLVEVGIQIGEILLPVIQKIINWVKNLLKGFTELDSGTKSIIVTIAGIAAALGPVLVVGGKIMKGISSITGALSKMGGIGFGPIGIAITAITALSAAGVALFEGWKNAYKDASPFTDALEEIKTKNDELQTSISNTKTNYENATTASEANAAAAQGLYGHLQNLIAGYDGTSASQLAIQTTINELNELVPNLGLSWDSVTNSLNLNEQEIYAQIEAMKAQAKVAALQEMYTDSLKDQYYAQKNLTDSARTLQGVLDVYGVSVQEAYMMMADGNITTAEAIQFLTAHGIAIQDAQGYTEELCAALQGYFDARQNQTDADANATFAEQELTTAMQTAAQAAADSSTTVIDSANNVNEQVDFSTAEQTAIDAGTNIPNELANGMTSQSGNVGTAADTLETAITNELAGTPAEMNSTGSDGGSQLASGLKGEVNTVKIALGKIHALFKSELSDVAQIMQGEGTHAGQSYGQSLTSANNTYIVPAIQAIILGVRTRLSTLPGILRSIGSMAGQGLYSGLGAWEGQLAALSSRIANTINANARRALQVRSPSRVMMEIGEYTGEGLQIGLEKSAAGVYAAMDRIAGALPGSIGNTSLGLSALNTGINTMAGRQSMQTNATANMQQTLNNVMSILTQYLPHITDEHEIMFDDGTWAGKLAPSINKRFEQMNLRSARG